MTNYKVTITPSSLREANIFVDLHHRHHQKTQGGKFAIAISLKGEVVGVAIVGRPVSRHLDTGFIAEVTRLCVLDGVRNGCSMLYGACWRAARAMGYLKMITYTLPSEGGASLRGSGFTLIGEAGGGNWNNPSRPRVDSKTQQIKFRWEIT